MGLREAGETHLDEMDERSGLDTQPQNEEGEDGEGLLAAQASALGDEPRQLLELPSEGKLPNFARLRQDGAPHLLPLPLPPRGSGGRLGGAHPPAGAWSTSSNKEDSVVFRLRSHDRTSLSPWIRAPSCATYVGAGPILPEDPNGCSELLAARERNR